MLEPTKSITITDRHATFAKALEMVKELGTELPSLKEFIQWVGKPNNYLTAKYKAFWLNDESRLNFKGPCMVDYDNGTIEPVISMKEWNKLPTEQKCWAYPGKGPLAIFVCGNFDGRLLEYSTNQSATDNATIAYITPESKAAEIAPVSIRT